MRLFNRTPKNIQKATARDGAEEMENEWDGMSRDSWRGRWEKAGRRRIFPEKKMHILKVLKVFLQVLQHLKFAAHLLLDEFIIG